jgi:diguanylate cyclase (GGDEF)-like protein
VISGGGTKTEPIEPERLLVVGRGFDGDDLIASLRTRYPAWTVASCRTYLAGIADLGRRPARAVVACIDPGLTQLDNAVAGLRDALGREGRLVLCCRAEAEPVARRALASGADDYVLYPIEGDELDEALGYTRSIVVPDERLLAAPAASMEELTELGGLLSSLGDKPMALVEKTAALVRRALGARGATVVVQGTAATSGEPVSRPVLMAPLKSGSSVIGQLSVGPHAEGPYGPGDAQKLIHYASVIAHVLDAAARQRQWRQLAATDECTGLPNRRCLHEKLDEILAHAAAGHLHVTILLFDVDDFKTYNDTYGHDAGDEILRGTGELFRKHCRDQDVVARYGGDEFVVVFWDPEGPRVAGSSHPECALGVLERFKHALHSEAFPCLGPSGRGRLTISGGLATYPWDGHTKEDLLRRADEALLAAKRAGKNRIFLIGQANGEAP